MLTPSDVRNKEFERSKFGGYKPEDVDAFMAEIAQALTAYKNENDQLERKLEVLAEKLEEYRADEESLRSALVGAQKLGDSVVRESKHKAEVILRDANYRAEQIVQHAKQSIENEQLALTKIQKEVTIFKNRLLNMYRQHIEMIRSIPGEERSSLEEQQEPAPKPDLAAEEPAAAPEFPIPQTPPVQQLEPDPIPAAYGEPAAELLEPDSQREPERKPPFNIKLNGIDPTTETFDIHSKDNFTDYKGESRFGPLKFGAGYDLSKDRDDNKKKSR